MTNQHLNNLLFLLAGSSLALACDITVDDGGDTGGNGTGTAGMNDTGNDTQNGDTATPMTDDAMPDSGDTAADDDTGSGSAGDTAGDTAADTGTGDDTAGDTGEDALCVTYANHLASCRTLDYTYEEGLEFCEGNFELYTDGGKECLAAGEELYACLATADCKELANAEACSKEIDAVNERCPEVKE